MAIIGGQINPAYYPQPDYSGVVQSAQMQAREMANLGASIGGAIKDFGEAKKERKKLDAEIKASVTGIESAIKMGESLGIDVKSSLSPYLEKINDPTIAPIEAAALAQQASSAISNILNFGMKANELGIQENKYKGEVAAKQLEYNTKLNQRVPESISFGGRDIGVEKDGFGNIYDPDTGREIRNLNKYAAGAEDYGPQANQTGEITVDGVLLPLITPELGDNVSYDSNTVANAIDYANSLARDKNDVSNVIPIEGGTLAAPTTTAAPTVNKDLTPRGTPRTTAGTETYRDFTPEEIARYGSQGQVSSTGKRYTDRPPSGTEFIVNPDGSTTYRQGAGVGGKNEKAAAERQKQQSSFVDEFTKTAAETIELLPSLPDNPVGAKFGSILGEILPGTEQGRVVSRLNTIKANLALDKINQMRAASPTGGAAGTMTVQEWPLFMQEFGSLDAAENKQDLEARLKNASIKLFNRVNGTPEERQSALEKGDITKEQNEIVQKQYDEMLSTLGISAPKTPASSSPFTLSPEAQDVLRRHPATK